MKQICNAIKGGAVVRENFSGGTGWCSRGAVMCSDVQWFALLPSTMKIYGST